MSSIRMIIPSIFFGFLLATPVTLFGGTKPKTEVKIALIHNFSKSDSQCFDPYGKHFLNAYQMALDDFNSEASDAKFGVSTELFDHKDDNILVMDLMKRIASSKAIVAMGLTCSGPALLGGKIAQEERLPFITPSASDDKISLIGDYVFQGSFKNSYQASALADVAYKDLALRKTLIIKSVNCAYCSSLSEEYKKSFEARGGSIAGEINILTQEKLSDSNLAAETNKFQFDSVLVPDYKLQSIGIISLLLGAGINVPYLGGDGWGNVGDEFVNILQNPNFKGYSSTPWSPSLDDKKSLDFVKRFKSKYGMEPHEISVQTYDTTMVILNTLKGITKYDRASLQQGLKKLRGHKGITGYFSYREGQSPKKSVIILKSKNRNFEVFKVFSPEQ